MSDKGSNSGGLDEGRALVAAPDIVDEDELLPTFMEMVDDLLQLTAEGHDEIVEAAGGTMQAETDLTALQGALAAAWQGSTAVARRWASTRLDPLHAELAALARTRAAAEA